MANKPPEMAIAAVHAFLFYNCFELFEDSAQDVEQHWTLSVNEAFSLGVRSCPTWTTNLIVSQEASQRFGDDVLAEIDGFYRFDRARAICFCDEWTTACVCNLPSWALDLDPGLAQRGLLFPVRNDRGWIVGAKVFRHVKDQRPFRLRVRQEAAG